MTNVVDFPEPHRRLLLDSAYLYALDCLDADECADIDIQLAAADSATRRAFYGDVRALREALALAAAPGQYPPPVQLRLRTLHVLANEPAQDRRHGNPAINAHMRDSRTSAGRRWRIPVAAAAAVVITLGAVVIGTEPFAPEPAAPTGSDGSSSVIVADDTRTITTPVDGGGTVRIDYSRNQHQASVNFSGVPAPPDGSVYQMWLLDGTPHSAGLLFGAQPDGNHPLTTLLGGATTFAVTIEPAGGSSTPTSLPIVRADLI
ncbi:anti-sigma factor [Rhodococcus sp. G-MC3]|uniref:anti-sigma factor n=1 Tax=Rhodococcus sp. G-MC3 TaxID=3046209 RepID=UPI0024BA7EFA|nr:anti-sigma factor [Rhodococcus sp. G-MC3]MDJ0392470.1 anti-sigma factor [Rhodococcus sp. G-MC3]